MNWVDAKSRRPKAGERVIIALENAVVTCGWYAPPLTISEDEFEDEVPTDYSEELDGYFITEGWRDELAYPNYHDEIKDVLFWADFPEHPNKTN